MLPSDQFTIKATVELFPQAGGWHYIRVPRIYTEMSKDFAVRGLVPIVASTNNYSWNTSLLPFGDGTHFIALNAKVRKLNQIKAGDKVNIMFRFNA